MLYLLQYYYISVGLVCRSPLICYSLGIDQFCKLGNLSIVLRQTHLSIGYVTNYAVSIIRLLLHKVCVGVNRSQVLLPSSNDETAVYLVCASNV